MTAFKITVRRTILAVVGLTLVGTLAAQTATAEPMKCSGQEKTCDAACAKTPTTKRSACLTACGVSMAYCSKTGCWVYGGKQFCGLLKQ